MKNTYIAIIVLVLVVAGGLFLMNRNKAEAPVVPAGNVNDTDLAGSGTDNEGMGTDNDGMDVENTPDSGVVVDAGVTVGNVKEFTITGENYKFIPDAITVNKGDKVRIIFKNTAGMHDFKIDEFNVASKTTKGPSQEILEFTASKAGTFEYYCSVGSHRQMGMVGTLTVK